MWLEAGKREFLGLEVPPAYSGGYAVVTRIWTGSNKIVKLIISRDLGL